MISNFNSFPVDFWSDSYVESSTIRFVGWFSRFFAICKISVNGFFGGCFDILDLSAFMVIMSSMLTSTVPV